MRIPGCEARLEKREDFRRKSFLDTLGMRKRWCSSVDKRYQFGEDDIYRWDLCKQDRVGRKRVQHGDSNLAVGVG